MHIHSIKICKRGTTFSLSMYSIFTPSVSDGCNSFGTFSVCVCVCLALTGERTNIRTWILVWRSSGRISSSSLKVKVIGQRSRSPGQKTFFFSEMYRKEAPDFCFLPAGSLSMWNLISYTNVGATTLGVFKAFAFFFFRNKIVLI